MARPPLPNALKSPLQLGSAGSDFNDPWMGRMPVWPNPAPQLGQRADVSSGNRTPSPPVRFPAWFDAHDAYKTELGAVSAPVRGLLDLIGYAEVEKDQRSKRFPTPYDVPFAFGTYGRPAKPLSEMTVDEVGKFQDEVQSNPSNPTNVAPMGLFQVKPETLREAVAKLSLKGTDMFDGRLQTAVGHSRLKHRGMDDYLQGHISPEEFQDNLAKEWSALPNRSGQSYYGEPLGATVQQVQAAIAKLKEGR